MPTQVLPSDDSFAWGSDLYGTYPCMYLGCKPSSTFSDAPTAWAVRLLHSGYQVIGSDGISTSPAAMLGESENASTRMRPGGFIYRALASVADVTVEGVFRQFAVEGSPNWALAAVAGVMARVQGGSLVQDGTLAVSYNDPSCYIAYYRGKSSTSVVEFVLARVNTGTFTTLTSTTKASTQFGGAEMALPMRVSMTATTSGADVALSASFTGLGMSTPVALSYTDTGASVLTAAGRCGFTAGRDRRNTSGAIKVVDLIERFSIASGATILLDDQFQRYALGGAYDYSGDATYLDMNGNDGRSLQMAYYWDQFTGGDETPRMERDTVAQRIEWTGLGGDSSTMLLAMASRPVTNIRSQHRSLVIEMPSQPTAGQRGVGIMLRASQPAPVDGDVKDGMGYAAWIYWQAGGTTTPSFAITRYRSFFGISDNTVIATYDDTASAYWSGYGATFEIDFEVYNQEGSTSNGPAVLKLGVDLGLGYVQVPLISVGATGILVDASGTVTDPTNKRVSTGGGEGILFYNTQGDTGDLFFDTWTEESLTNADLADRDQASIVVAGEGTATGVDLSTILGVDYPLHIKREHYSIVHPYESGHRTTNPRFTDSSDAGIPRTRYSCSVRGIRPATLSTFLDYWHAHLGVETALPWTAPGAASATTCHFVEDSLRYQLIGLNAYALTFQLEELL